MNKPRDRTLRDWFEAAGCPTFRRQLETMIQGTYGPESHSLTQRSSGLYAILHLHLSAKERIDLAHCEYSFELPEYDHLRFETLQYVPTDAATNQAYTAEDLIVSRNHAITEGASVEGIFLARAIALLPADLNPGETVQGRLFMDDAFGERFRGDFQLRFFNERKTILHSPRGNILETLTINEQQDDLPKLSYCDDQRYPRAFESDQTALKDVKEFKRRP